MSTKLSRFCSGIIEAGWLAALISVPLFFNIHSERVFEPDKVAILRSIAVLIFMAWIVRFIDRRGWQQWARVRWQHEASIWRIPFLIPILALIAVYAVSTLFSITPRISWSGSYQRLQGTYTTLAYLVIFLAAASTIRDRLQISRIPTAVIITSIPVAFYGLIQHYGLDPLPWGGDVTVRVAGHLGNAIFIAAYLIMAVPLTVGRIIDAFTNILGDKEISYADVARSAVYVFALAIQLLAIYWSGSRGPLLGLAAGLFSFFLVLLVSLRSMAADGASFTWRDGLLAFALVVPPLAALLFSGLIGQAASAAVSFAVFLGSMLLSIGLILLFIVLRRGWKWLWLSWLLLTIFAAAWMFLFNLPQTTQTRLAELPGAGSILAEQLDWKELPNVGAYGRMADPTQTTGRQKSNRVRVLIWEGVLDLITPHAPLSFPDGAVDSFNFWRPLIGYGPESMYVAYNRFYPPELAVVEARNASPDRAHNETFDALVITGLAGFLAWQALYVSVFYYGFTYLGVVHTRRDGIILIGSWVGGALLGALLSFTLFDPIYLGVAVPIGTVLGLIFYLFYYALHARPQRKGEAGLITRSAFDGNQLLVNALLAAVLAHYIEVHLGIAIAATRLEFFLFVALIFVIAYKLPQMPRLEGQTMPKSKGKNQVVPLRENGLWGPLLSWAFLIALMIGTQGYDFTSYVLPPDKLIETGADLLAGDIFRQTLFVNAQRGFQDMPFVFLTLVLSWVFAVVIVLSEMIRHELIKFDAQAFSEMSSTRWQAASIGFLVLGVAGLGQRFLGIFSPASSVSFAGSLMLLGGVICLYVAWLMFRRKSEGRSAAAAVAAAGLLLAMPIMVAGSGPAGLLLALICLLLLFLIWDKSLRLFLLPPLLLGGLSFVIGLLYTYLQAVLLREALLYLVFFQSIEPISRLFALFFRPGGAVSSIAEARVLESLQAMRFLTSYYLFLFSMLFLAGYALAYKSMAAARSWGRAAALAAAALSVVLAGFLVSSTNMRAVQADMVFKRARPFDEQASQTGDPNAWDAAIAIYKEALEIAPLEDYYYLFLGRALLERAGLAETRDEQLALLKEAERRLVEARELNPLNTDHSANLARMNARWAVTSGDAGEQSERLALAEAYYQDALAISPQNSLIRNELARLTFDLKRSCDQAVAIYEQSLQVDPYFVDSYFGFADVLAACAEAQAGSAAADELYQTAAQILERGLSLDPERTRAWIQAGQINQRLARPDRALEAFEQARDLSDQTGIPTWNLDFLEADVYREIGELATARALAEQALQTAPPEIAAQIESFLATLE